MSSEFDWQLYKPLKHSFSSSALLMSPKEKKTSLEVDLEVKGEVSPRDSRLWEEWHHLLDGYSKHVRPNYKGAPTHVFVEVSVLSFGKLSERDMTFTIDLFVRQTWHDYRLMHNFTRITLTTGKITPAHIIWVPDTVFINAMESKKHEVTVSNEKLDINGNGNVLWGTRITVVYSCMMKFEHYPMDIQKCGVGIESYAYTTKHIVYHWNNLVNGTVSNPVYVSRKEMAQFDIGDIKFNEKIVHYPTVGNYSVLYLYFEFKRQLAVSIIQIFFPTTAIVAVSWIAFYIHKNSVPSRVTCATTTLFSLSFLWGKVNQRLPKVSYIKAIDEYFMVSFSFILLTLIEYALVINTDFRHKKEKQMKDKKIKVNCKRILPSSNRPKFKSMETMFDKKEHIFEEGDLQRRRNLMVRLDKSSHVEVNLSNRGEISKLVYSNENMLRDDQVIEPISSRNDTNKHIIASRLDIASRYIFPLSFLLYNIYFWFHYSSHHSEEK